MTQRRTMHEHTPWQRLTTCIAAVLTVIGFGLFEVSASAQDEPDPFGPSLGDEPPPPEDAPSPEPPVEPPVDQPPADQPPAEDFPPEPPPEQGPMDEPPAAPPPEGAPVDEPPAAPPPDQPPVDEKAAAEDASKIETVVVTSQFREQDSQDTPLSITAIDGEMLDERSQTNIAQVANQAPNVRLSPAPGTFGPSLQAHIRGVGQHDFNYALEPGVGVYVDDVYFATLTGSIFDLLDLERVEVLRGPQGTLMGQNSIGGSLKLYSKPPDGDGGGFVQTTYGRYNRTEVRGAGDFTVIDDYWHGRIAGVGKHKDGYVTRYDYACTHPGTAVPSYQISDECELGTEGGKSYAAARAMFRFLPVDQLEVNLIGDYTNDDSEATPNTLLYVGGMAGPGIALDPATGLPYDPETGAPRNNMHLNGVPLGTDTGSEFISYSPFGNYAQDTYSDSPYINYSTYTNPHPLTPMLMPDTGPPPVASTTTPEPYSIPPEYGVNSWGVSGKIDIDLTEYMVLTSISAYRGYGGAWSVDEGTPISPYLMRNRVEHDQFSEELRLNIGLFEKILNLTIGGFLLTRDSHYGGRVGLANLQFLEDSDINAHTYAAFGNADWEVIDGLNLIAGGRFTMQDKTFLYGRTNVAGVDTPFQVASLDGTEGEFEGDRVDWRGAVQYRWIPELMTYVQVATGFRSGGVNPRPFFEDQALPHDPETLTGYEIGAKTDWLDNRLRVNVSGFFNQYDDILMSVRECPAPSTPTPCIMPINAGEAYVMGGEFETVIYPVERLGFDGTVSYLYFEYQSISQAAQDAGVTLDMTAPFAPEWQASVGARYGIRMGSRPSAWTLTPRLDLAYQDSFFSVPSNTEFSVVDARVILNGRLTLTSPDELWLAAFEMTNITDQLYYYGIRDDRASTSTVTGNPAPPLEWAVSLRRNFE